MADTLELDYESRSDVNLTSAGLDRYSSDRSTRVLMAAYAFNGGPWQHWEQHKAPVPGDLREALMDSRVTKWAFNAQFERIITRRVLGIPTPIKGWRCVQVLAAELSFGGDLAQVGERIGLPFEKQKLNFGKRLIRQFTMPQVPTTNQPHLWRDWRTDPDDWELFCEYNIGDGVTERAVKDRLIRYRVPEVEWELYEIDQVINDRGNPVDLQFVRNAIEMSSRRKAELTSELRAITGLSNPGSPVQLTAWLRGLGYPYKDLRKETVKKVLAMPGLAPEMVAALKLRQWQARLSVKKYDAMLQRECGGKLRHILQMGGAPRTMRWAGRGPQTQNLPVTPDFLEDLEVSGWIADVIRNNDYDSLSLFTTEPMDTLVGALRSSFVAPDGYEFTVADLASIETAVVAWLTDCERLQQVFRDGKDPYKDFGVEFFGVDYDVITRAQRKFCKPPTLGCIYRLGGGELIEDKRTGLWGYSEAMGVEMTRAEAHRAVKVFRETYPEIPAFWKALEVGIERTLRTKQKSRVGKLVFEFRKPFLIMWLPSGRGIYYFEPQLKQRTVSTGRMVLRRVPVVLSYSEAMFKYGVPPGHEVEVEETYTKLSFTYMGQNQKTRAWQRIDSHGGRTTEQATQGMAREVLALGGMIRAHRDGFRIVSHVHDELVTLQRKGDNRYTLERLIEHMKAPFDWAPGLALGANGYTHRIYRKD